MSKTNHDGEHGTFRRQFLSKKELAGVLKVSSAQSKTGSLNDDFHICVSVRD